MLLLKTQENPLSYILISVYPQNLQIYKSKLVVKTVLYGTAHYLRKWKLTLAFLIITTAVLIQLLLIIIAKKMVTNKRKSLNHRFNNTHSYR